MPLIALAGPKGSGKTTIARWLASNRGFKETMLAGELKALAARLFPRSLPQRVIDGPSGARDARHSDDQVRQAALELTAAGTLVRHDPDVRDMVARLFKGAPEPVTHRQAAELLARAFVPFEERLASPRRILQHLGTEWGRALWDEVWLAAVRRTVEAEKGTDFVVSDCRFRNEADYLRGRMGARVYWVEAGARLGDATDRHLSEPKKADLIDLCAGEIDTSRSIEETYAQLDALFPKGA